LVKIRRQTTGALKRRLRDDGAVAQLPGGRDVRHIPEPLAQAGAKAGAGAHGFIRLP
jgi:hypothetical protein